MAGLRSADFMTDGNKFIITRYLGNESEVVIPKSTSVIAAGAFKGTAVTKISFESECRLKSIEEEAFADCASLVCVDFSNLSKKVSLGKGAFRNCVELNMISGGERIQSIGRGCFDGDIKAFILDGAYWYPQPWLYQILVRANACFPLDPITISTKEYPTVLLYHPMAPDDLLDYLCNSTAVPVGAKAGYSMIVCAAQLSRYDDYACTSSALLKGEYPVWTIFDLPDEESVRCCLREMEFDEITGTCRKMSFENYQSKQRAVFASFEQYVKAKKEQIGELPDYRYDRPITEKADKVILINTTDQLWFRCNCSFAVEIGDLVTIKNQGGLKFAVVRDVCDGAIPDYTQPCEIIGAYRQTVADPGLFRRAIAIAAFPDIYRNKTEATAPRRKLNATVKVHFENGKTYQYNCTMAATVGDHVRVGGKLADQIGTITEVLGSKSRSPYMQEILEVIEQENCVCASSHEWTFGLASEDFVRPKAWRKPKNSVSVQVQFDNNTTLTYNSDYYVAIGDAIYVTGKYWGEIGTVTAFEGAWIHDYRMEEVLDVYEEMSEKLPLYIEHPEVIDDDYPFAYDRPNEMVRMINMARGGDQDAIRRLISIYSDEGSPFYHERKATYWKSKEN